MNMNAVENWGGSFFDWILEASWQASVLVALVLIAQWALGNRLSPGWRYGLWLLVVARLLMPASPQSAVSVFNLAWLESPPALVSDKAIELPPVSSPPVEVLDSVQMEQSAVQDAGVSDTEIQLTAPAISSQLIEEPLSAVGLVQERSIDWRGWATGTWFAGVVVLGLFTVAAHFRFGARIRRFAPVKDPEMLGLLEECRVMMGVRQGIVVIETEEVETPAVFGLWNKRLLLPDGIFESYSNSELRHIFLHELAHLKRRDLEINCLASVLQAWHWFNPVLWLGFSRMHSDREQAADALALSHFQGEDPAAYGETILKVLEGAARRPIQPGLVGIAESKERMKQRLRAIAQFGVVRHWKWAAGLAAVALGATALTGPVINEPNREAPGHHPKFVENVDPGKQSIEVTLDPVVDGGDPEKRVKGRIVDGDQHAIEGAVIEVNSVITGRSTRFGSNRGTDPMAVTDEEGRFVLRSTEEIKALGLRVNARGFAPRVFPHVPADGEAHELILTEGASLHGRVFKKGNPFKSAVIGVCAANRDASVFAGHFEVSTDEEGNFMFVNLPPNTTYYLYGKVDSLGAHGCIPAQRVQVQGDGIVQNAGALEIQQGYVLEGRIVLSDGRDIPEGTRVTVARNRAWDIQQREIDHDGRFTVIGLPLETISISTRIPGYRLSLNNASLDPISPSHLAGTMVHDKRDLILELEPGKMLPPFNGSSQALEREPIRGAEKAPIPDDAIQVAGKVLDAETGERIPAFTLMEGRADRYGKDINWFETRRHTYGNGAFTHYFSRIRGKPAMVIEAKGYFPQVSEIVDGDEAELTFKLERGDGYSGVVISSDGKPVSGADVYLISEKSFLHVTNDMAVRTELGINPSLETKTRNDGEFFFPARYDAHGVVVIAEDGYAELPAARLRDDNEVRLSPWASVEGRLKIGADMGAHETIRLTLANTPFIYFDRKFPFLSLWMETLTGEDGRFQFDRVPPMDIKVVHSPGVHVPAGYVPEAQTTMLRLNPAETKRLQLGGVGRPVIGRVIVTGYDRNIDWRYNVQLIELIRPDPPRVGSYSYRALLALARTEAEKTAAKKRFEESQKEAAEKLRRFYQTEAGRQYHFRNRRYALNFKQDGSFRIEDVEGGTYKLRLDIRESPAPGQPSFTARQIAGMDMEIVVPDTPEGERGEAVDLGTIELDAKDGPKKL